MYDMLIFIAMNRSTVLEYVHRHQEKAAEITGGLKPAAISPKLNVNLPSSSSAGPTSVSHDLDVPRTQGRSTGSTILVSLLRVRQCCSHLSLLKSVSFSLCSHIASPGTRIYAFLPTYISFTIYLTQVILFMFVVAERILWSASLFYNLHICELPAAGCQIFINWWNYVLLWK